MTELRIDPEFRDKIPPLTEAEFDQLKENILNDGEVYEPICVWNGTIVDGHNRWKIVQEHPEIPYRTKDMQFVNKWEAFEWMYRKQLGRRNLTDEQRTVLIGKMFEARKKTRGSNNQYIQAKSEKDQNDTFHSGDTAQTIANELGIGRQTVKRAEKFSKGIDILSEVSHEAVDKILKGGSGVRKKDVIELPQMEPEKIEHFAQAVLSGEVKEQTKPKRKGNTREAREQAKLLDKICAEMYDLEHTKEFTIDMMKEQIEANSQNYVDILRGILTENSTLLVGENRQLIADTIDTAIGKIRLVRNLVA